MGGLARRHYNPVIFFVTLHQPPCKVYSSTTSSLAQQADLSFRTLISSIYSLEQPRQAHDVNLNTCTKAFADPGQRVTEACLQTPVPLTNRVVSLRLQWTCVTREHADTLYFSLCSQPSDVRFCKAEFEPIIATPSIALIPETSTKQKLGRQGQATRHEKAADFYNVSHGVRFRCVAT